MLEKKILVRFSIILIIMLGMRFLLIKEFFERVISSTQRNSVCRGIAVRTI